MSSKIKVISGEMLKTDVADVRLVALCNVWYQCFRGLFCLQDEGRGSV